jgi:hypothetical protein
MKGVDSIKVAGVQKTAGVDCMIVEVLIYSSAEQHALYQYQQKP